jgi:hypothetical protein
MLEKAFKQRLTTFAICQDEDHTVGGRGIGKQLYLVHNGNSKFKTCLIQLNLNTWISEGLK